MVVDEDLIAALKNGQVATVGLDTYEGEPKLNPGYLPWKNTFLLHLAQKFPSPPSGGTHRRLPFAQFENEGWFDRYLVL
jgi:hypothetical protein